MIREDTRKVLIFVNFSLLISILVVIFFILYIINSPSSQHTNAVTKNIYVVPSFPIDKINRILEKTKLTNENLSTIITTGIEIDDQTRQNFYSLLKYNSSLGYLMLSGIKDNSPIRFDPIDESRAKQIISPGHEDSLIRLKLLFDYFAKQTESKVRGKDIYLPHIGITLNSGESIEIISNYGAPPQTINLDEDITIEINKILYKDGYIYFTPSNTYSRDSYRSSVNDIFIKLSLDKAIDKLSNAKKASTVMADVTYYWAKMKNIQAGEYFSRLNHSYVQDRVYLYKILGLDDDKYDKYVYGGALVGGVDSYVRAGGVCFYATLWSTNLIMGLDAFNIDYKIEHLEKHNRVWIRYMPKTVWPYIDDSWDYYDVSVFYNPSIGGFGLTLKMPETIGANIKSKILYANEQTGRLIINMEFVPLYK